MPRLAVLPIACALLLAACGKEQEPAPPVFDAQPPRGERPVELPEAGMAFVRPRNWTLRRREAPGAFELVSGEAVVSGWAYVRDEELPEGPEQLEDARERLVEAIEERDPRFERRSSETTEVAGAPAIEVRGEQVLAKRRLRTRSVHVFEGTVEYVFEAIAPPEDHALVDERVFEPLLDSLELEGEAGGDVEG